MASYSVVSAKHATLSTTVGDVITLTSGPGWVVVSNRTGSENLSVRAQHQAVPTDITTLLEDDVFFVPPGGWLRINAGKGACVSSESGKTYVKVKGSGNAYSVEADT